MKIRALIGACTLVSLAVVSGCNNTPQPPPATSAPQSGNSSSAVLPHDGAPKVETPLPGSTLSADPCQTGLTPSQVETVLGSGQKRQDSGAGSQLGPSCAWSNLDTGANVVVAYDTKSQQGLSGVYQNTKPQAVVWRVLSPIQGFPAVAHATSGVAADQNCQVSVGVSDQETVDVSIGLSSAKKGTKDPCEVTERTADLVMTNLKHKAGS
ncbi:DUF3558 domain-containing protein [Amycolatopsis circi]|uniref:DUF3558 domain-containing protein n=1 Tax=Amycolatopsis circi TaxID=871959 RepID=UPI000E25C8C7|nr:DUF3558 domain-containing protein [Amycolatopsis circi]